MEGDVGKVKNLSDTIHGDRSLVRGTNVLPFSNDFEDKWPELKKYSGASTYDPEKYHRCYKTHPPLKLPGTDLVIYGGSCITPAVTDADIYIGFDEMMHFTERHWPWKKGTELLFKINDMSVPSKPEEFKKLVAWTKQQVLDGKKVHCGCIGGHGRTGTFLAALVSEFGEKDAVTYVRENYCKKAVESTSQTKFLTEHFGIKKAAGTKPALASSKTSYEPKSSSWSKDTKSTSLDETEKFTPIKGNGCIFDRR